MRLGLVLGKSIGEVRALPYPEFKKWKILSYIEPWGWQRDEENTARILAMLFNVNNKQPKAPNDFVRDMPKDVIEAIRNASIPDMSNMSFEEKREFYRRHIMKDFGIQ
jgi:hypothetical protein